MRDKETAIREGLNAAIDANDDTIAEWLRFTPLQSNEIGRLARIRLDLIECLKSLDHRPPVPFKPQG